MTLTIHQIGIGFTVVVWAFFAYTAFVFYRDFEQEVGTVWQRIWYAAYNSGTILWTKLCTLLAAVVVQLDNIVDLLGAPELKDFIDKWVGSPKVVSAIILGITAVTYFARMRRSSNDPIMR